eukprot:NODE_12282_length_1234_cov_7.272809.p1 GENE.NODE_12282_length_1234_cov_7.272809~~NODE_12282_length_1234_cov_7.272809.p1  ORF type:complete len:373 (+),score=104.29 NODE_12282_length_1234_cov_7.272809:3-1121(+)
MGVMDIVMCGPVPPMDVLLRLVISVDRWLTGSARRVLIVHGESGGATSAAGHAPAAVLCACYLSWIGEATHPKEALINVCEVMGLPETLVSASHLRYLSYYELLQRQGGVRINTTGVVAAMARQQPMKLLLVAVLGLSAGERHRALEVRQQGQLLFRADIGVDPEAEDVAFRIDSKCWGDITVTLLRAPAGGETCEELEMRVCFHTAFMTAGATRFPAHEVDMPPGLPSTRCSFDIFLDAVPDVAGGTGQRVAEEERETAVAAALDAAVAARPMPGVDSEAALAPASPALMPASPAADTASPAASHAKVPLPPGAVFDLTDNDTVSTVGQHEEPGCGSPLAGAPGSWLVAMPASGGRAVFAADDVDSFFDDL